MSSRPQRCLEKLYMFSCPIFSLGKWGARNTLFLLNRLLWFSSFELAWNFHKSHKFAKCTTMVRWKHLLHMYIRTAWRIYICRYVNVGKQLHMYYIDVYLKYMLTFTYIHKIAGNSSYRGFWSNKNYLFIYECMRNDTYVSKHSWTWSMVH